MVNDNVDRASQHLDFNFVPNYQQTQQQLQQQEVILQRSCSGYDLVSKDLPHVPKDLLVSPLIERELVNSADNLSWTFFEQVSSVDNHLRFDVSSDTASYAGQLMPTVVNDVNSMVAAEQRPQEPEQQQHQLPSTIATIANISNGSTIAVDIVSQNPTAVIKPKQHKRNNSIINATVEATFKQTPQKQQLHTKQYYTNNNNNQKGLITKNNQHTNHNNDQPPSPLYQQQKSPTYTPTNDINHSNATATAMITGGTLERDRDTAAAGTNTSRSTRIRNLPAISKLTAVYADSVDLVGDTKRRSKIQQEQESGQQRGRVTMGATSQSFVEGLETHLGLVGWRKKCLYTLLVLLMLLIIVNLVLTLWILKVMEFSTEGMGQLKIIPGGIQLTGQALIMDMLRASTIRSRHGQPISIESSRNFSINTRDTNGILENHLFLGHDKLECLSTGFHINDTTGRNLFSVNRDEVTIGAHALRIDGEGGAIFRESIQTPHVRAEPGRELRLESPTRQLEMTAAKDINLQSRAGGIELSALEDVKLSALDGSLRLESSKILMPNLRTAQPPLPGTAQNRDHLHRVFQLCACSNGKLFLAAPHSICAGDDSTVCR